MSPDSPDEPFDCCVEALIVNFATKAPPNPTSRSPHTHDPSDFDRTGGQIVTDVLFDVFC
jgi:hypothetical protein